MASQCAALTSPHTQWSFCPSIGASYLFTIFFALVACAHFAQAIIYRKAYCWVITTGALLQTIAYIFRDLSIKNPANFGDYVGWFVLILVAPLLTNAFVYMVVGRMVWNFTPTARIFRITAWRFGLLFVVLDIIAFVVQVYGAATAAGENQSAAATLQGLHIYMGGVGMQQGFILFFLFFTIKFHRTLLREPNHPAKRQALVLLYTLYAVLALITMRIIFRLCEYSQGLKSTLPNHEAYQYCLDSLPMLVAFVLLNVVHPGRIMPGKESDLPSRKDRKRGILTKSDRYKGLPVTETMVVQNDKERVSIQNTMMAAGRD